ncbi:phosphoethanolamine--lipid A transferase EptA [Lysobacter pythonis]|uniref:Phosphoethanolamine--lipid A transferase EptA n=1 Tax=Solilutibacter pythonis TaxID=2483112 RepID=A0A3M2HQ30_9GAMM|nr:phosphoethanolamine--lipid A transferase EptA [Lysobacter pythonis]RMH88377.1 phosphoethanolamine--lipid A transferase EptA [Lysobacter pythonis]
MRRTLSTVFRKFDLNLGYAAFLAAFTLFNLLVFQWPLYRYAIANSEPGSLPGLLNLLTLSGLQVALMAVFLTLLSLLSIRLTKTACILILLGNALALYFMTTYGVLIDKAMMGNVFNTDRREAGELFSPGIIGYLLALGVLPALVVAKAAIRGSTRLKRLGLLLASAVLGCAMIYASSSTWLWFDKHAKHLGGLMLPWSYIANTIRHFQDSASANRPQAPLPPLHFEEAPQPGRKTIVVLVIGESARAKNFSLYGYAKDTNPQLAKAGVVALGNTVSCSTYTTASLRCMLSHLGSKAPARVTQEILPNYLQRHGVEVIWRSNNWGEPPLKVGLYQRAEDIRKTCTGTDCARLRYDEALLYGLKEKLQASDASRIFVVLHQAGSHGPQYAGKYPREFERFTPVCRSVNVSKCPPDTLVNAYDNTILYTDHFLAETIQLLRAVPDSVSTMIYMSDHGESLGERGFYLHGTPNTLAPDEQRAIPFLVWTSPGFSKTQASAVTKAKNSGRTQDDIFHSVLGAFDARSDIYNPTFDIFAP